jgi:YVTN family beta-propeller protein
MVARRPATSVLVVSLALVATAGVAWAVPAPPAVASGAVPVRASAYPGAAATTEKVIGVDATLVVGEFPTFMAEDPTDGWIYVTNSGSGTVSVLNGARVLANLTVGGGASGIVYDPVTDAMYVSDTGAGEVSIIHGTQVVATVRVGPSPETPAFDAADGWVYVPNFQTSSVSILNNTTVVATIPVGEEPTDATYDPANATVYITSEESKYENILQGNTTVAVAATHLLLPFTTLYDPLNQWMYVTNVTPNGGIESDVTVLNGSSDVATFPVGPGPGYPAVDSTNGWVYLPSAGLDTVQILNGTSIRNSVPVGGYPMAAEFDPSNGDVYTPDDLTDDVSVINESRVVADVAVGEQPTSAMFDTANDNVYVADRGGGEMNALGLVTGWEVNFTETGLPTGTSWAVTIGQVTTVGHSVALVDYEANGSYAYTVDAVSGYNPQPATGPIVVDGSPIEIVIHFSAVSGAPPSGVFGFPNPFGEILIGSVLAIAIGGTTYVLWGRRSRKKERLLRV